MNKREDSRMHGILTIPQTPFTDTGAVDKRRGIIKSTYTRAPGRLDRYDHAEIDRLLRDVEPLFKVRG